ncbi:MAG TPA: rhomboid family intramembrane serine protease [Beijerinckiaceae bacterium]|nr:rhomboid family intramembrane serine protease [Beijerinckiaceae bacterium]
MFLPINDGEPLRRLASPWVTWGIIGVTCAIFVLFQSDFLVRLEPQVSLGFGLIPSVVFGTDVLDPRIVHAPAWLTPVTHLFLHGNLVHLAGNMLFLWVFADNVEDEMGHARFAVFYLLTGIIAGLVYALTASTSQAPLVGASGAVSGVLGGYLLLHPNVRVFGLFLNIIPVRIPAFWFILGWFALQVGHAVFDPNRSVAWIAHVVGLIAGAVLVIPFRKDMLPARPVLRRRTHIT